MSCRWDINSYINVKNTYTGYKIKKKLMCRPLPKENWDSIKKSKEKGKTVLVDEDNLLMLLT